VTAVDQCRNNCVRPANGADGLCASCRLDRQTYRGLLDPVRRAPLAIRICEELGGVAERIADLPSACRIGPFVTGATAAEFGVDVQPVAAVRRTPASGRMTRATSRRRRALAKRIKVLEMLDVGKNRLGRICGRTLRAARARA
jgi:hypothetical protein